MKPTPLEYSSRRERTGHRRVLFGLVVGLLSCGFLSYLAMNVVTSGEPHTGRSRTLSRMNTLASLAIYADITPTSESSEQLVSILKIVQMGFSEMDGVDVITGKVLDTWGNPIQIQSVPDALAKIRLVSFGPNGRGDRGEGDDIVVEQELAEE